MAQYGKNTFTCAKAEITGIDTRYVKNGELQLTTVKCYECQGKDNQGNYRGLNYTLTLFGKTSEYFLQDDPVVKDKSQNIRGDEISFTGTRLDNSFDGDNGKVWAEKITVDQISILKRRDQQSGGNDYAF